MKRSHGTVKQIENWLFVAGGAGSALFLSGAGVKAGISNAEQMAVQGFDQPFIDQPFFLNESEVNN